MRIARTIEAVSWILGIALLGGYAAARVSFEHARQAGIEMFRQDRQAQEAVPPLARPGPPAAPAVDQSLWSEQRIRAFAASAAGPGRPEALLRIPEIGLAVPVYAGVTDANLNRGAAHVEGTATLTSGGNIGIAAHRDGFFRKLKDVAIDDELELDVDGRTLTFRVVELSVVSPHDTDVLAPTASPSVTLVTCFPFYFIGSAPQRYIVRAELIDRRPVPAAAGLASLDEDLNSNASTTGASHED